MTEDVNTPPSTDSTATDTTNAAENIASVANAAISDLMLVLRNDATEPTLEHYQHVSTIVSAIEEAYEVCDLSALQNLFARTDAVGEKFLRDRVKIKRSLKLSKALDALLEYAITAKTPDGQALFFGFTRARIGELARQLHVEEVAVVKGGN